MKKRLFYFLMLFPMFILIHCSSVNYLAQYDFDENSLNSHMLTPPQPRIFADDFWYDHDGGLITKLIRFGTTVAKEIESYQAQQRLNDAMTQVDVPERIRWQSLESTAKQLHFCPVDSEKKTDFTLSLEIKEYGIEAHNWDAAVEFKISMKVKLIDNAAHRLIYEKDIDEEQPVTANIWGLGTITGNIVTATALASLSEEEMIAGFSNLADYMAATISKQLNDDYLKAHAAE